MSKILLLLSLALSVLLYSLSASYNEPMFALIAGGCALLATVTYIWMRSDEI